MIIKYFIPYNKCLIIGNGRIEYGEFKTMLGHNLLR